MPSGGPRALSKGNQQKVQFIATVLHDPDVLLMDEPFSGLDPINVALLKAAFLELRDRGKTLVFSTHQLDQAEELCDSVAIIDHGRIVTSGSTRDVKRSTGHQVVRVTTASDGDPAWLRSLPHVRVTRPGKDFTEVRVDAGANPQAVLRAAMAQGRRAPLRGGRPVPRGGLRRAGRGPRPRGADARRSGGPVMSDLGNITAVARREYTVRVRTRSFVIGTLLLLVGVLAIAFVPVIIQAIDQGGAQKIAVHVAAGDLGGDPVTRLGILLNATTDTGAPAANAAPDYAVTLVPDLAAARQAVGRGEYSGALDIGRAASGDLAFVLYTNDNATGRTAGLIRQASTAIAIADRLARLGVAPAEQANLFAPTEFGVAWPDPARTGPTRGRPR